MFLCLFHYLQVGLYLGPNIFFLICGWGVDDGEGNTHIVQIIIINRHGCFTRMHCA